MRKVIFLKSISLLLIALCFCSPAVAQEKAAEEVEKKEEAEILSISDITNQIEISYSRIDDAKPLLEVPENIQVIYQQLDSIRSNVEDSLNSLNEESLDLRSYQEIKNIKEKLRQLRQKLESVQSELSNRNDDLQEAINQLDELDVFWQNLLENQFKLENKESALKERILDVLKSVNTLRNELLDKQKEELKYLDITTGMIRATVEKINMIESIDSEMREDVFIQDSPKIWEKSKMDSDTLSLGTYVITSWKAAYKNVKNSLPNYEQSFYIHLVLIIVLWVVLYFYRERAVALLRLKKETQLKAFFEAPLSTAIVVSFFFSKLIYGTINVILVEFILLLLLIPLSVLVKKLFQKTLSYLFYGYVLLFLLNITFSGMPKDSFENRIFTLILQVLIILLLGFIIYSRRYGLVRTSSIAYKFTFFMSQILLVLMALALITNVLGVMRLSLQITTGTLNTIGIGLLLYLTFSFTKLGILFLVEFPLIRQMNIIVHHKQKVRKKMVYYTGLVFLIWFVVSITNQFDVARNIADAWNEFVNQSWEFGTVKVSIGDFLTFFTILFFTILISNVLRYLLGKEILVRLNLKRGIPNAISITLYYFILVVGLFLAASSTGIEWDKINLAVGALGVGIGFGLQNVVYNFISGLILIYERPVQVGDTIEIGSLMGNVTKIGVRASRVRTYGGGCGAQRQPYF
jgi:potassium efflux system protein